MFNKFFGKFVPSDVELNRIHTNTNSPMEFVERKTEQVDYYKSTPVKILPKLDCCKYVVEDLIKRDPKDWISFFRYSGKVNEISELFYYRTLEELKDNSFKKSVIADLDREHNIVYHNILASLVLLNLMIVSKKDYNIFYPILFGGVDKNKLRHLEKRILELYLDYVQYNLA